MELYIWHIFEGKRIITALQCGVKEDENDLISTLQVKSDEECEQAALLAKKLTEKALRVSQRGCRHD